MSNRKIGVFLLGGAVGAVIALLVAPRSGVETRAIVSDRLSSAWNGAQDFGAQTGAQAQQVCRNVASRSQDFAHSAAAFGQEVAQEAASRGQDFVHSAVAGVRKAAGSVKAATQSVNGDELRDKIEAARQRIATQVVRNANETGADSDDAIDVAAEPVADEDKDSAFPSAKKENEADEWPWA